jgi:hypothetical protein
VIPTSPARSPAQRQRRRRSTPRGSGSWNRPAAPDTARRGPACASNRTPAALHPPTGADAARPWPSPEGPGRGQCVAYSFDEIDHQALLGRVRGRIGDKRVVGLVKAFLRAGVLSEDGVTRDTKMGTPQGGILSPLLANIALSVLDDHFAEAWQATMATRVDRARRRRQGGATYRLVRYADDFVVMVAGTKAHAEGLRDEVAGVLATVGLRLAEDKTMTVHIDEGFDFLGFRIQRQTKRGSNKAFVYTWPAKKALASIKAKVKAITTQGTNNPLSVLLRQLNGVVRGWTNYFRHGVSTGRHRVSLAFGLFGVGWGLCRASGAVGGFEGALKQASTARSCSGACCGKGRRRVRGLGPIPFS